MHGNTRTKQLILIVVSIGVLSVFRFMASAQPRTSRSARIVVHTGESEGEISPYIYGLGLEWLDNGNGVLDPTTHTLRTDILSLLQPLRVPVWRFPGGILSDYYHWRDGVGPVSARPLRTNPMDDTVHSNDFGTDELIAFCRAQNSQLLITANFGTGSLDEALAWQTYLQMNGLPARFWEIGNEIYLAEPTMPATIPGDDARIYKTPAQYAAAFPAWAHALRSADPTVLVGAIAGTTNTSVENRGWLDTLLSTAAMDADFIALHNSFAPLISTSYDYSNAQLLTNAYGAMYAQAGRTGDDTQFVQQRFAAANPSAQSRIAITEHFPLFGAGPTSSQLLAGIDQSRTQGSALFTAGMLHTYIRQRAWMANYNIATSPWFGALITDTPNGLVKTPTYYVYDLYRNHFGTTAVGIDVTAPSFNALAVGSVATRDGVSYLDAVASRDADGRTYLAVINRDSTYSIDTLIYVDELSASTPATVYSLQASQVNAINGSSLTATTLPATVTTQVSKWSSTGTWVYAFPPNSVTVLVW